MCERLSRQAKWWMDAVWSYEQPGSGRITLVLVFSVLGALSKITGSILYGSRALFVDALTSIAGIVGLLIAIYYLFESYKPPDQDHPFGHVKLRYGGVVAILSTYMFVTGFSTATIYYSRGGYSVEEGSMYAAIVGALFYSIAIVLARNVDESIRVYAGFTASELLEAAIVIPSTWLGYSIGYVYDLVGAMLILAYLFYEAVEVHRSLVKVISDTAPPRSIRERVVEEVERRGLRPVSIRLRMVDEKRCAGDMVVKPEKGMAPDIANVLADEAREELLRMGCDIVIHIDYSG